MILPAKVMIANKLAEVQVSMAVTDEQLEWADIIVWQRQYKDNLLALAKQFADLALGFDDKESFLNGDFGGITVAEKLIEQIQLFSILYLKYEE